MTRKTAIVTGANAGLGFETTRALARNGYRVIMACRNPAKAEEARRCLLEVRRSNKAARRLYQGSGFALDGVRKNYYPKAGGREDALLMSREL